MAVIDGNELQVINTKQDLVDLLESRPNLYQAIPEKVRSNFGEDFDTIVRLFDLSIQKGILTLEELAELIQFETCESQILDFWAEMFGIPIPTFPNESHFRTHRIQLQGDTTSNQVFDHILGTDQYKITVQTGTGVVAETLATGIVTLDGSVIDYTGTLKIEVLGEELCDVTFSSDIPQDASDIVVAAINGGTSGYTAGNSGGTVVPVTITAKPNTGASLNGIDFDILKTGDVLIPSTTLFSGGVDATYTNLFQEDLESGALGDIEAIGNKLTIENPSNKPIFFILFTYHKDYDLARRRICQFAFDIRQLRYSRTGLILYLRLLLNNNCIISISEMTTIPPVFQFLSWDGSTGNFANAKLFDPTLVEEDIPRILTVSSGGEPVTIIISADLQDDIIVFIEQAVQDFFIPFPLLFVPNLSFIYSDYSDPWEIANI